MDSGVTGSTVLGRAQELLQARAALAAHHGVVVVGEAGIGTTTLLSEALTGRTGSCRPVLPFAVGAAPLQQALGGPLPVGDPAWIAQWIGEHLGRAVLRLDDLQWADATTLATVALLVDRVPLAVSVRTGDVGTRAALDAVPGLERVDLAPLPDDDAVRLAARTHPRLRPVEAAELARRCGGNPLLIEELGSTGEPSLRRSLVRRLRRMGAEPWTGFALLSRAGEPVPPAWVPGLDALQVAGLLHVDADGGVGPRQPLLAETVVEHLADGPVERRRVDLLLAERAEDGGRLALAAGAYAAAGERASALRLARAAAADADRPGERAALLGLAAESPTGPRPASWPRPRWRNSWWSASTRRRRR